MGRARNIVEWLEIEGISPLMPRAQQKHLPVSVRLDLQSLFAWYVRSKHREEGMAAIPLLSYPQTTLQPTIAYGK